MARPILIGGEWRQGRGDPMASVFPADGSVTARLNAASLEDVAEAIEAYSGALALRPDSMVAHLRRGDMYRRQGANELALRDLRDASALDPTAPQPAELKLRCCISAERRDSAIRCCRSRSAT